MKHRPSQVGVGESIDSNISPVNLGRIPVHKPQHQIGIVNAVPDERGHFVQSDAAGGFGKVAPRIHGDDFSNPSRFDRLFRQGDPGIESADVTDHEKAIC